MATMISSIVVVVVAAAARPQVRRVGRAERLQCKYSKEGLKKCESLKNLSPAVLKGLGLRRSSVPWGPRLVEERMDEEDTRLPRLMMRALNPDWVLACVVGYILFNPRRFEHYRLPPPLGPANSRSENL